jgi:hypothetical protein
MRKLPGFREPEAVQRVPWRRLKLREAGFGHCGSQLRHALRTMEIF